MEFVLDAGDPFMGFLGRCIDVSGDGVAHIGWGGMGFSANGDFSCYQAVGTPIDLHGGCQRQTHRFGKKGASLM
jgi:hypothetical protein